MLTAHRQTRRQIARALHSGNFTAHFMDLPADLANAMAELRPALLIFDCDTTAIEDALLYLLARPEHPPLVLLSVGGAQAQTQGDDQVIDAYQAWKQGNRAKLAQLLPQVQGHPLEYARHPQAVVSVKVGDADAGDLAGRHPGEQHLPLGSLTRVEQQPFAVPAQEVAVVIAAAGGRLARRAENH